MIFIIDTKQKTYSRDSVELLLRKKNQPDPLTVSENTPECLQSHQTPRTRIWLIFQFKDKMQSGRVKPATQQNKATPRSVCLLIF